MANAAINILGDGSICDICAVNGCVSDIVVTRTQVGTYQLEGTLGLVPPPDGWGVVTNPMDRIATAVSFDAGVLQLETTDANNEPVDIPSRVTLHIVVKDAPPITPPPPPEPDPEADAMAECVRLRSVASEAIQMLQDMVDIGEGNAQIEEEILAWKRYRVALSRVADQVGWPLDVEWPGMPER